MSNCFTCGILLNSKNILKCENCAAINFCSIQCQNDTFNLSLKNHLQDCDYYKVLMKDNKMLSEFPFKFDKNLILNSIYMQYLIDKKLFNQGFWRFKCPLEKDGYKIDIIMQSQIEIYDGYILPSEAIILSLPPSILNKSLYDWKDYFNWRDLSLESPIAALLHWPLTVYHMLNNILNFHSNSGFVNCHKSRIISIHFIGVEIELNVLPAFLELQNLFPNYKLKLSLIGNEGVPHSLHMKRYEHGNVAFLTYKSLYHESKLTEEFSSPDVVVGFNSGLSVFDSWRPTVDWIAQRRVPALFSDYCRFSADASMNAIRAGQIVNFIPISINPFRSPFREEGPDVNFYFYSNSFIYGFLPIVNKI